jgi:hypothetical protein
MDFKTLYIKMTINVLIVTHIYNTIIIDRVKLDRIQFQNFYSLFLVDGGISIKYFLTIKSGDEYLSQSHTCIFRPRKLASSWLSTEN